MVIGEPRATVCLSMIVRDEADVVSETLGLVAAHIDYWVIVDTGSTDATIETVRAHMAATGLPGEVHERPWRDFGFNRTEALQLCRGKADYIWVIDADDVVVGDLDLGGLCSDSYLLRYGDDFRYWRKQIFRDGLRWRYKGVVHEYPLCLDPATEERLEGDYYIDSRRVGARSRAPDKYRRDCQLLRGAVERDPNDARSAFYLAQSYYDAGDYSQALWWYTRRAEMRGWAEEVFYSLLRRADCLTRAGEPWERALAAYLDAWQERPTRAEPLHEIAGHYRLADRFELGYLFAKRAAETPYPQGDSLFVAADVYGWRAADELAICAYYTGRHEESFELWTALLEGRALPESERERLEANRTFCVPHIEERRGEYPAEVVERLTERVASNSGAGTEVTLTITSCRRPVLFERTVNSFLRCCTDLERIGRWICVDNGSAEVDRARMRELYPFFEFNYTDPAALRHADSMNLLQQAVASPFWLHLEDDWLFFWGGPYVERATAILRDDPAIAQVAFNRNYCETLEPRILGGQECRTAAEGIRYRLHDQIEPHTPEWQQHLRSLPAGGLTNAYWPHFTLRPSLMRTEAIRSVGGFDTTPGHFELEFARRYAAAGLKTAFLDQINCLHTGRLTTQGAGEGRLSAYELVGDGRHPAHPAPSEAPSVIDEELELTVINLDRRPERWEAFQQALSAVAGVRFAERCRRRAAIDGTKLSETPEIRRLFRDNDFALRRGMVGCALSHISIWRSLAETAEDRLELVFEDDARPGARFDRRLAAVLRKLRCAHAGFDLAFLGYFATDADSDRGRTGTPGPKPMRWERYVGGTFAYLISGRGARKLIELVERDGVQNGIDTFLVMKRAELSVLECDPTLVEAPLAFAGNGVDSDIQHDFQPIAAAALRPRSPRSGNGRGRLATLAQGLRVGELRLDVDPAWPCSGATIAAVGDRVRVIVRTAGEVAKGELATLNYVLSLDQSLEVRTVEFLAPGKRARWYDGCRLVCVGDALLATALERSPGKSAQPVLLRIDSAMITGVTRLTGSDGDRGAPPVPFAAGDELRLLHSWSPVRILGVDADGSSLRDLSVRAAPALAAGLSAGSPGVPLDEGWLFVAHDRATRGHRLILLDREHALSAASSPFAIADEGEERCWGLVQRDRELVISFGVEGRGAALARLPASQALALLEPCG